MLFRRRLWFFVVSTGLVAALALFLGSSLSLFRAPLRTDFGLSRFDVLLPGQLLPAGVTCLRSPYQASDSDIRCRVSYQGSNAAWINLDRQTGRITHTLLPLDSTLGELVLVWGAPSGLDQESWTTFVYWGNRYVSTGHGPLSPQTPILYLYVDRVTHPHQHWAGFQSQ